MTARALCLMTSSAQNFDWDAEKACALQCDDVWRAILESVRYIGIVLRRLLTTHRRLAIGEHVFTKLQL
jgi:hypothetical protein